MPSKNMGIPLPPMEYHGLHKLMATYQAKLWVLYGNRCPHFQGVKAMVDLLGSNIVEESNSLISPLLCLQLVHEVIIDSRSYFGRPMHPDDFEQPGGPRFKSSTLSRVSDYLYLQTDMPMSGTFPTVWMQAVRTMSARPRVAEGLWKQASPWGGKMPSIPQPQAPPQN